MSFTVHFSTIYKRIFFEVTIASTAIPLNQLGLINVTAQIFTQSVTKCLSWFSNRCYKSLIALRVLNRHYFIIFEKHTYLACMVLQSSYY